MCGYDFVKGYIEIMHEYFWRVGFLWGVGAYFVLIWYIEVIIKQEILSKVLRVYLL